MSKLSFKPLKTTLCLALITYSTSTSAAINLKESKAPAAIDIRYYMAQGFNEAQAENLYYRNTLYQAFFGRLDDLAQKNYAYLENNLNEEISKDGKKYRKLTKAVLSKIQVIREQILFDMHSIMRGFDGEYDTKQCIIPTKLATTNSVIVDNLVNDRGGTIEFNTDELITKYSRLYQPLAEKQVARMIGYIKQRQAIREAEQKEQNTLKKKSDNSPFAKALTKMEEWLESMKNYFKGANRKNEPNNQAVKNAQYQPSNSLLKNHGIFIYCADMPTEKLDETLKKITKFRQMYLD